MREKIINKIGSINDAQIELQRYAIDAWSNITKTKITPNRLQMDL